MQKTKFLAIAILIGFICVPAIGNASFFIIEVKADTMDVPDLEAGDISAVLDVLLDNITAEIAPATSAGIGAELASPQTVSFGKVIVRASTFDYSVREYVNEIDYESIPVLHNAPQPFLQAYWQVSKAINSYSLKNMLNIAASAGSGASLQSIESIELIAGLSAIMGTNDTSSASGFNDEFTEKYTIEDLTADTEYVMNATDLINYGAVEEQYQFLANFTESNETATGLLPSGKDADDKMRMKTFVSGFDNVQESIYDILAASIAANYSTPGDQINPERVSILESDADNANETDYLKANFVNRVRAVINNEFFEAESSVMFLGLKLFPINTIVPVSALPSTREIGARLSRAICLGRTVISAPFRQRTSLLGEIKEKLWDTPIKQIKDHIVKAQVDIKSLTHTAINAPETIVTAIQGKASAFVQKMVKDVSPLVKIGQDLATKGMNKLSGFASSLISMLPMLVFIAITLLVIGLIVYVVVFYNKGGPVPA